MSAPVDVLAVMRQCANVATCNSQRYGGPTLKQHAEDANAARAAVAELIEAADLLHMLSISNEEFPDWPDGWNWIRIHAALARVKGA